MQTFLPYSNFEKSIKTLDNQRLGKQRVEAMQMYRAITIPEYGWKQHPCTRMWWCYPEALQHYMNLCIDEWVARGFNNTMQKANIDIDKMTMPNWLGDDRLHDSHKSNLLQKNYHWYQQFGWNVPTDMEYYWCGYGSTDHIYLSLIQYRKQKEGGRNA
tara:strand:+ start:12582 stop:13055 length:474 start_codon:yes stop_codon:yes gene_type:complete